MDFHLYFRNLIAIVVIIVVAVAIERTIRYLIGRFLHRRSEQMNIDKTKYVFLKHVVTAVVYSLAIIAIIYTLPKFRTVAVSLFAGAGIFAAILGFASQAAFSNIISGVFMVISKPFKVGDRIEVGNKLFIGVAEDITLRHTVLRNVDNQRVVIPNSVMGSETITNANLYDDTIRRNIDYNVDFNSDIDVVMKILQEECEAHPLCIDHRSQEELEMGIPKVKVRLLQFGDNAITFRAYAWANNISDSFDMHTDLNVIIKKRFDKEGISMPFPQRVISYRNNES